MEHPQLPVRAPVINISCSEDKGPAKPVQGKWVGPKEEGTTSASQDGLSREFLGPVPESSPLRRYLCLYPIPHSPRDAHLLLPLGQKPSPLAVLFGIRDPIRPIPGAPPLLLIDLYKSLPRTWPGPGIAAPLSPPVWHKRIAFFFQALDQELSEVCVI